MKSNPTLSILIPVKNEAINIKVMVRILEAALDINHEIIIIYDSEKDTTISAVKTLQRKFKNVRLVLNKKGPGVSNAIRSGFEASSGKYILIFASDDVGPVLAIEDMVELMEKGCDLVSCTRYAYGGRRLGGSKLQAVLSGTANFLFRKIVGLTLTDSTTGIKMFRKEVLENINFESRVGWAILFELTIKIQMMNVKMGEVPIISIDRLYGGSSSFKPGAWIKEYSKWFIYGAKELRKVKRKHKVMVKIPQNI